MPRALPALALVALMFLVTCPLAHADFTFVHVTDTHVTTSEATGSPAVNVAARFREISDLVPRPAFVIDTGDVCETATPAEYALFRRVRDENLKLPLYTAPGNHDVRWNPQGKEGYVKGAEQPLYQSWDKENVHFVLLDSTVLLQHWGHFDQGELDWLARDLAKVGTERPIIIGFHHWIGRETVQVDNQNALIQILAPYNVRLFLIGHGHSNIQWSVNGTPAIMAQGLYQGSYHLIRVTRDQIEVLRRTEENKTPTEVVLTEPLRRPPGMARRADVRAEGGRLLVTLARTDDKDTLPVSAAATCSIDGGTPVPLETGPNGWTGSVPLGGVIPGIHLVTVTATTMEGRSYQTPVTVDLTSADTIRPVWRVNVGGAVQGRGVCQDGTLYIPSMGGDLVALDTATGQTRWRAKTEGAVFSTPYVDADTVYFGSADHYVYAVERATGKVRWKTNTDGAVFAGANGAQGVVCIGSTDQHIYGLDAKTGKVIWKAKGNGMFQSQTATDGERFFVGAWDNQFRCFDARTGKEIWHQRFGRSFYYSPAIASPAVADGKVIVNSNDGFMHTMDTATGMVLWEVNGPSLGYSSPLWSDGRVYNASLTGNGRVFCFDGKTGAALWETPTGSVIYDSSCARGGNNIFVGCVNGVFSALRASDGHVAWQYHLPPGHLLSSPATDEKQVYIGTMSGDVFAFPLTSP